MPQPAYQAITPIDRTPGAQQARRDQAFEDQKRSFLRMVSHELRTPLNSILGFSEILASELYGPMGAPQYREYAEIIRGSGTKLLKLVNQVLEIARLESGAAELNARAEPLECALEDVTGQVKEDLAARDVRLVVDRTAEEILIHADPKALRTVVGNLLQNAVAFTPEGGEVRVRVERHGANVEIVIEDDGEGVDPADLPRLVKPFEQGENALTRRGHGAGLGLAICDLNCQAMGGKLKLISAKGQGLTARVQLPAG
ncbi:HAMP domain-containing sensor histidine kinase [Phenylobacterium sp.]|jgi:signal transduction histidine kinase|uniref:sensor histidine kinase n=1 Tax=Phenylobacterium sp. TaxID=1871053 RepID=UPI002F948045